MGNFELNLQNILLIIGILLLAANTISTLNKGKKDWDELSGQARHRTLEDAQNTRLKSLEEWRPTVESRLDKIDARVDEANKDTTEILTVLHSMIRHMQSGNDHAKLQETDDKLYKYLVEKRGVNPQTLA